MDMRFLGWAGRRAAAGAALGAAVLAAASAWAQQPASDACAPLQVAPDVVVLRDGTRLRGLVASTTPAQTVLLLPTGERRVLAASEISELRQLRATAPDPAGRPDGDSSVGGESAQLHLRGSADDGEPVTFYALAGTRVAAPPRTDALSALARAGQQLSGEVPDRGFWRLARLCTAPCDVDLAEGRYSMAVARGTTVPVLLEEPVEIRGETTLEARITSHAAARWAVGLSFVGGLLVGTGLVVGGFAAADDGVPSMPLVITGFSLAVATLLAVVPLLFLLDLDDDVDVGTRMAFR